MLAHDDSTHILPDLAVNDGGGGQMARNFCTAEGDTDARETAPRARRPKRPLVRGGLLSADCGRSTKDGFGENAGRWLTMTGGQNRPPPLHFDQR
jgi:hypothetical protein